MKITKYPSLGNPVNLFNLCNKILIFGFHTVCERRNDTVGFLVTAQLRLRLHRGIICHLNGNFVGFQNMYDFKRSDH